LTSTEQPLQFLIDSYKLRVDYLTKQFDRMWNRFQLLLGIDTALAALIFAPLSDRRLFGTSFFALLGIPISLFWYIVGAEDRFLVVLYRKQLERETDTLRNLLGLKDYIPVGHTGAAPGVDRNPVQFRFEWTSITHLVVYFPLLFLAFFIYLALTLSR